MVTSPTTDISVPDAAVSWQTTNASDATNAPISIFTTVSSDAPVPADAAISTNTTVPANARSRSGIA